PRRMTIRESISGVAMRAEGANLAELADTDRQVLEGWLVDFDQAWSAGRLAARAKELPPPGHPLRRAAVIWMIKIDSERQWEEGRRVELEAYVEQYPELGTPAGVPSELIHAEYEARRQTGPQADLAELARRFPRQAQEVRLLVERAARTL